MTRTPTYDHSFYLDEFMEGDIMCILEFFANVEKVDLTTGHHDADQRSVVCTKALQRRSINTYVSMFYVQFILI